MLVLPRKVCIFVASNEGCLNAPSDGKTSAKHFGSLFGSGLLLAKCLYWRHKQTIIQTYNLISTYFDTITII